MKAINSSGLQEDPKIILVPPPSLSLPKEPSPVLGFLPSISRDLHLSSQQYSETISL